MSTLTTIVQRLNQRIEASNIFDNIFGLSELNPNKKEGGYVHYIGNGQAEVVTNYDSKRGTIFWVKRGRVAVDKDDTLQVTGCKSMYRTSFPLTAYCVVRKSHLPCDNSEAEDWIAGKVNQYLAGSDNGFKTSLGVARYEVLPAGYVTDVKDLPSEMEWATLTIDFNVSIVTDSADNCYDLCSGDVPLPADFLPCEPCLTKVYTDDETIVGDGTKDNPLVAIGGGGGGSIRIQNEGVTLTNAATNIDFIGNAVTAVLNAPGDVHVNINQVQSDWNASSGLGEILNKPTIPAAQVNSDWNATSGVAEILNKPTIPSSLPPSGTAGGDLSGTYPDPIVSKVHGVDMQNGTPSADDVWVYGGSPAKWQHQKLHASQVTNDSTVTGTNVDDALDTLESTKQNALGFTPENVSNKSTDVSTDQASNTKYPSVKAVFDWASSVFTTTSAVASQITTALTGYATQAWVNSQGFLTAITSGQVTSALGYTPVTNARTITINGTAQDLSANRSWTIAVPTIYKSTTDTAGYSSTANTAVFTQSIPANTFAIGDLIRLSWRTRKTGTGGTQTLRIYVNATADLSGAPILCGIAGLATTTNLMNQMQRHFAIKSSTNNTEVYATSGSASTDFGQFASVTTAAIDWTANRFIVFAIQNSNAVDVNFGSFYLIEKL